MSRPFRLWSARALKQHKVPKIRLIAEPDGRAQVCTHGQRAGRWQGQCFRMKACICEQARQAPVDHALAEAVFQRIGLAHANDRIPVVRIYIAKVTAVVHKLGDEAHVHIQVGADGVQAPRQRFREILVRRSRLLVRQPQQSALQCAGHSVNPHRKPVLCPFCKWCHASPMVSMWNQRAIGVP